MSKRMLVDASHPEETRVAIVTDSFWLADFDFERASKKQLKGNIYLAKVMRIEPSLQAAFVEYGGNRHGFLPFSEIMPDYYRIPMADRPHDAPEEPPHADEPHSEEISADILEDYAEEIAQAQKLDSAQPSLDHAQPIAPPIDDNHGDDIGLITDFGTAPMSVASSPDMTSTPIPAPIETIGGDMSEQAEPVRRPSRHRYKIQEVIKRGMPMLIQVVKEERGNKGAALTTFVSLAGRYCVLMPGTDNGGGISRKITNHTERKRMKEILDQLETPENMGVILRTAGMEQATADIQRDLEYLMRLWNSIRERAIHSTAPELIHEEGNLIKRALRDLYSSDLAEILVAGERDFTLAKEFMQTIMPDQVEKIKLYSDPVPLFFRYKVEGQLGRLYNPIVQLKSGGYIVINPTEALVAIDVNSGRSTRARHIEDTALRTNIEAAEEIARQLRLRDLAGLVVIDFIDMEDGRNNAAVERQLKDAMRHDRARLQIGQISPFGLLELSRQRLRPSLMEINFEKCPQCDGIGHVRSTDSASLSILRIIEEEGLRQGGGELVLHVPTKIALYILNKKRAALSEIEKRYSLHVVLHEDAELIPPHYKLERVSSNGERLPIVDADQIFTELNPYAAPPSEITSGRVMNPNIQEVGHHPRHARKRGRFGGGRGPKQNNNPKPVAQPQHTPQPIIAESSVDGTMFPFSPLPGIAPAPAPTTTNGESPHDHNRRRGRRGGRKRGGLHNNPRGHTDMVAQSGAPHPNMNAPNMPQPNIPFDIHDLDTTPRAGNSASQQGMHNNAQTSSDYENMQGSDDKPKGGWWRKITGQ